jgi:hypothetical protein
MLGQIAQEAREGRDDAVKISLGRFGGTAGERGLGAAEPWRIWPGNCTNSAAGATSDTALPTASARCLHTGGESSAKPVLTRENPYVSRHLQRLLRRVCRIFRNISLFEFNHAGDAQADQQHCHNQAHHEYQKGSEAEFLHLAFPRPQAQSRYDYEMNSCQAETIMAQLQLSRSFYFSLLLTRRFLWIFPSFIMTTKFLAGSSNSLMLAMGSPSISNRSASAPSSTTPSFPG